MVDSRKTPRLTLVAGGMRWRDAGVAAAAAMFLGLTLVPAPSAADSESGVFLAARHSEARGDIEASARYYRRTVFFNREDLRLRRAATLYSVLSGEIRAAMRMARPLLELAPETRIAVLVGLAEAMRIGDYDQVDALLDVSGESVTRLERVLAGGWAAYGRGDLEAAEAAFAADEEPEVVRLFAAYHAGLMAALEGRDAEAIERFAVAKEISGGWTTRLSLATAAAHERLGDRAAADALYDEQLERDPLNPYVADALARREAGEPPALVVNSAAEGLAEAFYGFATAIRDDRQDTARRALVYTRLAAHAAPGAPEVLLLTGDLLTTMSRYEAAAEIYAATPVGAPTYQSAEIGRAGALDGADKTEDAIRVLEALVEQPEARPAAFFSLAELLNSVERYEECAGVYQSGIDRLPQVEERHWVVHFGLGICHERRGAWEEAETAFNAALELEPGQPDVLNYLGYSLVEMGVRFEEARAMIEEAAAARPESGYIVDSLGWVLYRMGDFEGAVRELERAVELSPAESVIHDHFGDALWMVGRKMEARFQWRRALSFEPDAEKDRLRIERKLDIGLDQVLAEEAAEARRNASGALAPAETETGRQGG